MNERESEQPLRTVVFAASIEAKFDPMGQETLTLEERLQELGVTANGSIIGALSIAGSRKGEESSLLRFKKFLYRLQVTDSSICVTDYDREGLSLRRRMAHGYH